MNSTPTGHGRPVYLHPSKERVRRRAQTCVPCACMHGFSKMSDAFFDLPSARAAHQHGNSLLQLAQTQALRIPTPSLQLDVLRRTARSASEAQDRLSGSWLPDSRSCASHVDGSRRSWCRGCRDQGLRHPRREHRRQRVERGVHRASRPCRRTRGSARSLDARLPRARAASEPTAIHDDFHGSSPLAPQSFELRTRGQLKREEERSRGDASGSEFAYDLLRLVGFFDLRDSH